MFTPIILGLLFGVHAVTGLLAGGMTSGVQMAISQSNTGGAWDNAKKWVEKEKLLEWAQKEQAKAESTPGYESKASKPATKKNYAKGSECHKASVVGDTVGDRFACVCSFHRLPLYLWVDWNMLRRTWDAQMGSVARNERWCPCYKLKPSH